MLLVWGELVEGKSRDLPFFFLPESALLALVLRVLVSLGMVDVVDVGVFAELLAIAAAQGGVAEGKERQRKVHVSGQEATRRRQRNEEQ